MRRRQLDSLSDMYAVASTSMASVRVCVCPSRPRTAANKLQPEPESERKVPVLSASDSQCPPNPRSSAVHASATQRLTVCNPKKKTGFRYFRYFPFGRLIA